MSTKLFQRKFNKQSARQKVDLDDEEKRKFIETEKKSQSANKALNPSIENCDSEAEKNAAKERKIKNNEN